MVQICGGRQVENAKRKMAVFIPTIWKVDSLG